MSKCGGFGNGLETLEGRTLLSAAALGIEQVDYMGGMQLRITGTALRDRIFITQGTAGIVVRGAGGLSQAVDGSFKSIWIDGLAGSDVIKLDPSITTDAIIHGSGGNDLLIGGSGNDQIYGDSGARDRLDGAAGDDTLVIVGGGTRDIARGGEGNDSFWTDTTDKVIDAESDEVAIGAVHTIRSFQATGHNRSGKVISLSKEALGQDLADPALTTQSLKYTNFSNKPLFSESGPSADDINQGAVGDCYFLSVLSSVAKIDPQAIRQSIVDLGDGTYAVEFHRNGSKEYVRVDADLPTYSWGELAYANTGAQGSLWVALMEKAFTYFRSGEGTYESISGGWMTETYSALGNSSVGRYFFNSDNSLMRTIKSDLDAGKSVTYATSTPKGAPLIGGHAYTVDSVLTDGSGKLTGLRLRNPWGVDGAGNDGKSDGYVTITAGQARASFLGLISAWV